MRVSGIDYGRKRIGLAVSEGDHAYPVGTIERRSFIRDIELIRIQLASRDVSLIVVGLPINMDGSEGPSAAAARTFAERLAEAIGIPVEMYDERLTTVEALDRLRDASISRAKRKGLRDALAATVMLQGWLEARRSKRR
ncbi:MAG TPA: Holliday junction resolvase RuvX [Candidatus Binataceae bacterium]|nr:Holliday junction resolvase RuvX [Candidatus Binataceae bacterium]